MYDNTGLIWNEFSWFQDNNNNETARLFVLAGDLDVVFPGLGIIIIISKRVNSDITDTCCQLVY